MRNIVPYNRIGLLFAAALSTLGAVQTGQAQNGTFNNWAGFEATNSQGYNYISAQWTVPAVTFVNYGSSPSQERTSVWIGFGGIHGNLLQVGTDSVATSTGSPTYTAWFFTVPAAGIDSDPLTGCHVLSGSSPVPCSVSAGDTIDVEIVCNSPPLNNCPSWSVGIIDLTQSWAWGNGNIVFAPDQTTAEFIVEAPKVLEGTKHTISPLPNFGTVVFSYAQVAPTQIFSIASNGDSMVDPHGGCANPTGASYDSSNASSTLTVTYANCPAKAALGTTNTHDFNGDGYSDIAWLNTATGDIAAWLMNSTTISQASDFANVPTAANWSIVGQADFNGDGNADLLWHNANGDISIWLMNGATISQATDLGIVPTAWSVAGTGDFNGDGDGDVLLRNTSTGDVSIWLMNSTAISQASDFANVPPAANWSIVGTGDFNGDGMTDILWRNTSTGDVSIWLMNGTTVSQASDFANVPVASGWTIAGTGDFNGDGYADILWSNTSTGDVSIWLMNGATISQASDFANVPIASGWKIADTGDFNGDGKSDILWRNTSSGDVAIWLMNGATISQATDFANVPLASGWTIQSLNAD